MLYINRNPSPYINLLYVYSDMMFCCCVSLSKHFNVFLNDFSGYQESYSLFLKTFVVRDHMNGFLIQQADNDFISSKGLHFQNYLLLSAYKQELKLGFYPEEEDRDL